MKNIKAMFLLMLIGAFTGCRKETPDDEKIGSIQNVMIGVARGYRAAEIFPPDSGYYDFEDAEPDIWGTSFRMEYIKNKPSLRSAGPDKIHYTADDLVVEY